MNSIIVWNRVLEKQVVLQLVMKLREFYGI